MITNNNNNNKKTLTAGVNTYQDAKGLDRLLKTIAPHMDRIFVVDGKYPQWGKPDDPPYSTDDTIAVCQQYPNVEYFMLSAPQYAKRSKYLELAEGYDFLLVIDCDEFIIEKGPHKADWHKFRNTLDTHPRFEERLTRKNGYVHNIAFLVEPPNRLNYFGKLIYKPSELYYKDHWRLYRKSDDAFQWYQNQGDPDCVHGIVMTGNENARSDQPNRLQMDVDYQWDLELQEGAITEEQYNNLELKRKFLEHQIHEMRIWQQQQQ